MLSIYSTFTSDINSLPCLACTSCQRGNVCVCVCLSVVHWPLGAACNQNAVDGNGILSFQLFVSKKIRCDQMSGRFITLCFPSPPFFPSFKFDPLLCPFHSTILSLVTSRDKHSQIGSEKETSNLFSHTYYQGFWMSVLYLYLFVCVSQHLRVEILDFIFLQGHVQKKSCDWLEHPVLDVNTVMQAGLSSLC